MSPKFYVYSSTELHEVRTGVYYPNYTDDIKEARFFNMEDMPPVTNNPYWRPIYVSEEFVNGTCETPYLEYYLLNKNSI